MLAGHRVPTAGPKGVVHIEQVLEYNRDSSYLRDALLYRLTIEAQRRVEASALSKREIVRRLGHYGSEMSHAARPALRAFWLAPWQPVLFGFLLAGDWIDTGATSYDPKRVVTGRLGAEAAHGRPGRR